MGWIIAGIVADRSIRMGFAKRGEGGDEIVAQRRQRFGFKLETGQQFEIHEMLGFLAMLQRQIGRIAPAIRLASQKGDAVTRFGRFYKSREIRGQGRERKAIDKCVSFIIPGAGGKRKKLRKTQESESGKKDAFHV